MNTDSDDPSTLDDHGLNMDSAPASHDDPGNNSDFTTDDPGIHPGIPGSSSSQRSTSTLVSEDTRCINCRINVFRLRRHFLAIAEVRDLVQRWVEPQQVKKYIKNIHNL